MSTTEKKVFRPVKVTSRIVFLKVGQIDTRNERYDAEAYIECFWEDDQIFKLLADPNMAKNGKLNRFSSCYFFLLKKKSGQLSICQLSSQYKCH
jgi:hypothetical protein